ncbi:MAG: hypothetical protein KDC46_02020 [Thermoleophilia bacterium]|nr:hypothetical protein [Thermoleophilia bacterium]
MSTARSAFTEAIEEHLALKKQNATIEASMPLARYDVGDPLDRYPGGPNRAADAGTVVVADDVDGVAATDAPVHDEAAASTMVGPSPEQAMEAASALEPGFADRPFEPLNGMAPMLSLVEDIEDDAAGASASMPTPTEASSADVLRFPGGVGPRDEATTTSFDDEAPSITATDDAQTQMQTHAFSLPTETATTTDAPTADATEDAPTGEQPVLVIDTDEPLATSGFDEPVEPSRAPRKRPRFFGLGRKKKQGAEAGDNWFTDGPRDFNWD